TRCQEPGRSQLERVAADARDGRSQLHYALPQSPSAVAIRRLVALDGTCLIRCVSPRHRSLRNWTAMRWGMERRTFLVGGASLGLAQAASAGEGIRYDPEAVEAALGRVDTRMQSLGEADFSFRSPTSAADAELLASRTRLGRSATRSLYFLGAFL